MSEISEREVGSILAQVEMLREDIREIKQLLSDDRIAVQQGLAADRAAYSTHLDGVSARLRDLEGFRSKTIGALSIISLILLVFGATILTYVIQHHP